ncbi:type IV secretory system conjugative DNA transfer family protein [Streptomyces sp. NBC_00385]|uniref:type IV secretory system conjugative DNA transfer family protein n=1 Tax=Streptomyces sp. NBC_00385 TaxID=2975733 RepID=UPI002DD8F2AF|nr:type IV secretory system conjugative DNA transfer family protein [Streptomyces sp. NBC_00385]WRZ05028.1 type IV secretory system conjugative DNA transfer family protein [Streptomyces sp. NBC_00385]
MAGAGRGDVRNGGGNGSSGGIPDGLLIGLLLFLLGLTLLAWTATGLAGLLAHGGWPEAVTLAETPLAMRRLVEAPHDLPAAWPATPAGELSGYGLFWGLFIGQLMVLVVLTVFVMGVIARWRGVRARQRTERLEQRNEPPQKYVHEKHVPEEYAPEERAARQEPAAARPFTEQADPAEATRPLTAPAEATQPLPPPATPLPPVVPSPRTPLVLYGPAATRRPTAVQAIREADGPVLVVTSDPSVWAETKDARAKLGPVLVYDPGHLCDTPARLHWSPTTGCEQPDRAAARSAALLAPVRPQSRIDAATADTAETLLRCWLHAAAIDGRPFRQVHRWALGGSAHEPVRLLRTHPKAASGLAGLLESALTAHPERREMAQELTVRAFGALSSVHIRDACTPNRADSLALESFVDEGGSLYVVGEPIENPRSGPGAMPLLTALASDVVEHGRRMAARSSDGRLDPPMALVLDDIAAVAPLPRLPELLTTGEEQGLPTIALLRSREQARAHWTQQLQTPTTL